jgi:hypothetical protein
MSIIGLVALERTTKQQASRITNLKEGDTNSRYFHVRVNARRRKNHVHRLKHNSGWFTENEQKKTIIHNHFKKIIKRGPPRSVSLNWSTISTP